MCSLFFFFIETNHRKNEHSPRWTKPGTHICGFKTKKGIPPARPKYTHTKNKTMNSFLLLPTNETIKAHHRNQDRSSLRPEHCEFAVRSCPWWSRASGPDAPLHHALLHLFFYLCVIYTHTHTHTKTKKKPRIKINKKKRTSILIWTKKLFIHSLENQLLIIFEKLVLRALKIFLIHFGLYEQLMISIFSDKIIFDSGAIFPLPLTENNLNLQKEIRKKLFIIRARIISYCGHLSVISTI